MSGRPSLVRRLSGALAALIGTAAAETPADVTGRWQPSRERPQPLPDYAIDIALCPDGMCGRVVHVDGACGPPMMRLRAAGGGLATGHIQISQWTAVVVEREGDRLTIRLAAPGKGAAGALLGSYVRQGPPACLPGDPWGDTPWFARPSAPRS